MSSQQETKANTITSALFVKMAISAWDIHVTRLNKLLDSLSDEELLSETAPGRNSGIYLIGHLAAESDALFPLLGWGERLYPELDPIFIDNPDKSSIEKPTISEIKKYWNEVQSKVAEYINKMQPEAWFTRHAKISEEDFAREPHRNKLNVLINRTNHLSYHLGQLNYLLKQK